MMKKKISKIVFLGANRYCEDGPLLGFLEVCQQEGIETVVLIDDDRINYPSKTRGSFQVALKKLDVAYQVLKNLTMESVRQYSEEGAYAICVNCHWIIPPDIIEVFEGRIFNYHNSALPEQRGAACHSWRIMQGNSYSRMTFHRVDVGVDVGDIALEQEIQYPQSCRNLSENYEYLATFEAGFFRKFIQSVVTVYPQANVPSFYWPRLNTEVHGFIDWAWGAQHIQQFCAAFDKPFGGASSFLKGIRVRLRDVEVTDEPQSFHPFQSGLIYRIENGEVFVAAIGGGLRVKDFIIEGELKMRVGMRVVTPPERLYLARAGRSD